MADADRGWSRRDFGRAVAAGAVGFGSTSGWAVAAVDPTAASPLAEFVKSLDAERRARLVLRGDDPRRGMVQNHWAIIPEPIAALTQQQQDLALALIRQVLTDEGFARWTQQRADDAGGWQHDHLAVFADAVGSTPVEWVVTGRHLTLRGRADGSVVSGPLFWGHTATGPASLGQTATRSAEAVWSTLAPADRRKASVTAESSRLLDSGLPFDQVDLEAGRRLLASLVEPFRSFALPAVSACRAGVNSWAEVRWQAFGPVESLPIAWRLLGPGFRWSVHSEPHFHAWFEST